MQEQLNPIPQVVGLMISLNEGEDGGKFAEIENRVYLGQQEQSRARTLHHIVWTKLKAPFLTAGD